MIKNMVRQYIRAYTWSRFKEQFVKNSPMLCYLVYFMFFMLDMQTESTARGRIVFFLVFLPMLHIYISGVFHSVCLNKMMYLCPMTSSERRAFVYRYYYFRICVHLVLALVGILLIPLFVRLDVRFALVILANDFLVAFALPWKNVDGDKWDCTKEAIHKILIIGFAGVCNAFLTKVLMDMEYEMVTIFSNVGFVVLLLVQIPLALGYVKYVKAELENAVEYEKIERDSSVEERRRV